MLYLLQDYQELGLGRALLRTLFAALRHHEMTLWVIWLVVQDLVRFFYEAMSDTADAERTERLWRTACDHGNICLERHRCCHSDVGREDRARAR